MKFACFEKRTLWWPTKFGWLCLLSPPVALLVLWVFWGEAFLARTARVPADTLIVEGWIGREGMSVAKHEFEQGGYRFLVVTGGMSGQLWAAHRWNFAVAAQEELLRLGFPGEKLLAAPCEDLDSQRTYESALAAKRKLEAAGYHPAGVNVMSRGTHTRRTRLVYARVFSSTRVGCISWHPLGALTKAWWESSERAKELMNETLGYFYEALLGSCRWLTRPPAQASLPAA